MDTDSVWEEERVLEMDVGDGCTTVWMFLMLYNSILKNSKFHVIYILLQHEKRRRIAPTLKKKPKRTLGRSKFIDMRTYIV